MSKKDLTYQDNVRIYEDTCRIAIQKFSSTEKTLKYLVNDPALEPNLANDDDNKENGRKPTILVTPVDSFSAAKRLLEEGDDGILVLNMANGTTPGGGVLYGSFSQEENLFRRSNYFLTLTPNFYPISKGKGGPALLISPRVTVFKDEDYKLMDEPFEVSCLAVAANFRPDKILKDGKERFVNAADRISMKEKIESIFKVAILHEHKTLVLSALGCGAFRNPVDDVIDLFNEALKKYGCFFDTIVFAVRSHKDGNYEAFKKGIDQH